jgi:hypothetical protein
LNKLLRIITVSTLAFGWLIIAPTQAYSDDPLTIAAQEIQELNSKVDSLVYQDKFINLIDIAENKFVYSTNAIELRDNAYDAHEDAVEAEATALEAKNLAQSNVDGQTAIVSLALEHKDNALEEKNDAQDALSIASINVQTTQSNMQGAGGTGLAYTVYNLLRNGNQAVPGSVLCSGTWNFHYMNLPVCGNRVENFIVKFTGQINVPQHWTSTYFAGATDDGFRMFINGQLAINNWVEQGVRWSPFSPVIDVTEDKSLDVEIWWYNGGGPGSYSLGWAIPGGWTGAGCDYTNGWGNDFSCNIGAFSSSGPTQAQTDAYNNAVEAQQLAQTNYTNKLAVYNDKLSIYNSENSTLLSMNQILQTKTQEHLDAVADTEDALDLKNTRIDIYNQSIVDLNNAINDAWEYYYDQAQRELNAAIAQAAANAAANQPTAEPSPEPTTEPTDEPSPEPSPDPTTEPTDEPTTDPTPEPSPEPTVEPTEEPTPEPTPEVTPEPEPTEEPVVDPTEEPTPEPSPEPGPDPEPEDNPWTEPDVEIKDEVLAALIPEKGTGTSEDLSGVIANLTSKDNKLVKLSAEQITAVSQTLRALTQEAKQEVAEDLGIKASEVAQIAEQMKSNPELASAFVEFGDRAESAGETPMPFTLADAVTEVQTEAFLADPLGAVFAVDVTELLSNFSELGMDMTDDQREKAQEVIIPVIIVSQIANVMIGMRR